MNTRGELAGCGPAHPQRQGDRQQPGANSAPETACSTKLQAGFQLLPKISWDSGWLTSTGRVAARDQLPRRDPQHTGDGVPTASQEFEWLGPGR